MSHSRNILCQYLLNNTDLVRPERPRVDQRQVGHRFDPLCKAPGTSRRAGPARRTSWSLPDRHEKRPVIPNPIEKRNHRILSPTRRNETLQVAVAAQTGKSNGSALRVWHGTKHQRGPSESGGGGWWWWWRSVGGGRTWRMQSATKFPMAVSRVRIAPNRQSRSTADSPIGLSRSAVSLASNPATISATSGSSGIPAVTDNRTGAATWIAAAAAPPGPMVTCTVLRSRKSVPLLITQVPSGLPTPVDAGSESGGGRAVQGRRG